MQMNLTSSKVDFGVIRIASSAYNWCAASFIFDLLEFLCLCCVCYMQRNNHCQTRHTSYCEQSVALAPCSRISLMTLCNVEKLLPCFFGGGQPMLWHLNIGTRLLRQNCAVLQFTCTRLCCSWLCKQCRKCSKNWTCVLKGPSSQPSSKWMIAFH